MSTRLLTSCPAAAPLRVVQQSRLQKHPLAALGAQVREGHLVLSDVLRGEMCMDSLLLDMLVAHRATNELAPRMHHPPDRCVVFVEVQLHVDTAAA